MALGQVDYGLMGVIGGLTAFITFFNGILSSSIGRYFALTVGESQKTGESGIEKSRMWFTTAVVIHTILPTVLMSIGYPLGIWAINNYLVIPPDRVCACIWVWRFVCTTSFLSMMSVPFNAMYGAHQYIAELTIYSFITTTLNAAFLYYMITHPGAWLSRYAFWHCVLGVIPQLIIAIRAVFIFPECRFRLKYVNCLNNIKQLGGYAFWNAVGALGVMLRTQGMSILVNKCFGPRFNAGVAVGTGLSGHTDTLSGSLTGAFYPALFNAYGRGDVDEAKAFAFRICKIGTLLTLVFALPLSLEANQVLVLWLKTPPPFATSMCLFVMAMTCIDKTSAGHLAMVCARGKLALYQTFLGTTLVMTLPLAIVLVMIGLNMYGIGIAMVTTMTICALGRVWFARMLVQMSAIYWLKKVLTPLLTVVVLSLSIGFIPRCFMDPSFARVCVTTVLIELLLLPFSWFIILDGSERSFIETRVKKTLRISK